MARANAQTGLRSSFGSIRVFRYSRLEDRLRQFQQDIFTPLCDFFFVFDWLERWTSVRQQLLRLQSFQGATKHPALAPAAMAVQASLSEIFTLKDGKGTSTKMRAEGYNCVSMNQGVQGKCITPPNKATPTRTTPFSKEKGAALGGTCMPGEG